ncbi:hypothetical protein BU16DRAFT_452991, partial [Lophium mytilinum]
LREIFGAYGQIQTIDLPMNRQFNTNRGTAYIIYYEVTDAEKAIAHMHEAQLDGAVINVSIVLPRRRFSRSPPRRAPAFDRFQDRGPPGGYRGPPPGVGGGGRYRSPPRRRSPPRGYGARGGRGGDNWHPRRSMSRSRSRSPRRSRSRSYISRSASRTPPRRRGGSRGGGSGGGRRRRSRSYDSYSSYSDRSRSRSRGGRGRR